VTEVGCIKRALISAKVAFSLTVELFQVSVLLSIIKLDPNLNLEKET
jgi:hypothetical protein